MTEQIYIILGIALGVFTLLASFIRSITKVTHMYDVIERLNDTMEKLIKRVDTIDKRMYENAVRNSQRR